jgi:hypothetical protein
VNYSSEQLESVEAFRKKKFVKIIKEEILRKRGVKWETWHPERR